MAKQPAAHPESQWSELELSKNTGISACRRGFYLNGRLENRARQNPARNKHKPVAMHHTLQKQSSIKRTWLLPK